MKDIDQLINLDDPGWPIIQQWIDESQRSIEVLPKVEAKAQVELVISQHTTKSLLGSIVYETGGILVENGWIRILGSGGNRLSRSLGGWNKGKSFDTNILESNFLLVADDAVGGFFAINGGAFGEDLGKIYYWSPDEIDWEPLQIGYSEFIQFCIKGNLESFYEDVRWDGWEEEVQLVDPDSVFAFFPPLWLQDVVIVEDSDRRVLDISEVYGMKLDILVQLHGVP